MNHLTIGQRQTLQAQLHDLIKRLRGEIASATHQSGSGSAIGIANPLQDIDDEPVANLETGLNIAAIERDTRELHAAERALEHLSDSTYGICADCGTAIAFERLHASPTATRCVACLTRAERPQGGSRHSL